MTSQAQLDSPEPGCSLLANGFLQVTNYTDATLENSTLPSNIASISISETQTLETISFSGMKPTWPEPGDGVIGPNMRIANLLLLKDITLGLRDFNAMTLQNLL
jgi:hypothetical protein